MCVSFRPATCSFDTFASCRTGTPTASTSVLRPTYHPASVMSACERVLSATLEHVTQLLTAVIMSYVRSLKPLPQPLSTSLSSDSASLAFLGSTREIAHYLSPPACFTEHNALEIRPGFCKGQEFLLPRGLITFHCEHTGVGHVTHARTHTHSGTHSLPFFRHSPFDRHLCCLRLPALASGAAVHAGVSVLSEVHVRSLRMRTQEWDCWIARWLHFQSFEESLYRLVGGFVKARSPQGC